MRRHGDDEATSPSHRRLRAIGKHLTTATPRLTTANTSSSPSPSEDEFLKKLLESIRRVGVSDGRGVGFACASQISLLPFVIYTAIAVCCSLIFHIFTSPLRRANNDSLLPYVWLQACPGGSSGNRVAIGWNCNLDLIVNGPETFKQVGLEAPALGAAKDHDFLKNKTDLMETFQFYFDQSAAAERSLLEASLASKIVEGATKVPEHTFFTGGNAALMASRLVMEGCEVSLGGPVGPRLAAMLESPKLRHAPSKGVKEDVHIILEYSPGEEWGGSKASRGNRFILNEGTNEGISRFDGMEAHLGSLSSFSPDLLIVTGINIAESQPTDFRTKRIMDIATSLRQVPESTPIHLELASFAEDSFLKDVVAHLFGCADSTGLNEQELADLYESMGGSYTHGFDRDDATGQRVKNVPSVAAVSFMLAFVLNTCKTGARENGSRKIARIHFHCLAYHIVAEDKALSLKKWLVAIFACPRFSRLNLTFPGLFFFE